MMNVKIKIIRSDSKQLIFDGTNWGITALEGIGTPEIQIFTEDKALGAGEIVTGKRLSSREISFTANVKNKRLNDVLRNQALNFFNPQYTYSIYITYMNNEKWIDGELLKVDISSANIYKPVSVNVSFLSADTYFKSLDEYGKNIASITSNFGFPYVSIINKGFVFSKYNFAQEVLIENDGDVDTNYCKIIITANGSVKNPYIMKDDYKIKINDILELNDIYEIDFVKHKVYKNGVNAMVNIDRTSDIYNVMLQVGDNQVSFNADDGSNNMDVSIYFNKLYLGV